MLDYGGFSLKGDIGNNRFGYSLDPFQELRVPQLREVLLDDLKAFGLSLGEKAVFSEIDSNNKIQFYTGLAFFYFFEFNGIPIYLFDNHNHAFAFWWREVLKGVIKKGIYLLHVDQHSDMNENKFQLEDETWESIVSFTNECCNVGNFIYPALDCGLIADVKQLRTEQGLLCFQKLHQHYILDIDLDYWDDSMSILDFEGTIKKVKILIQSASIVTIATSPYFLNQKRAVELFNLLFF